MNVVLDEAETEVITRVLRGFLGDLRMEIGRTEKREWREGLKADEEAIKRILTKLGVAQPTPLV